MKKLKLIAILVASSLVLVGCATSPFGTATSGGANYTYSKTADGSCQIAINSARDIAGANLTIGNDCSVIVEAESAGGANAIEVIGNLVDKLK